ncbi:unnamed protein product [Cladocopium goreaui]|uniref:Uncharacterized protein n=1 Tax=Cladocopium goreaui TaxID=2562237 RepID=A0A9P1CMB6_9DINO|nr:unnamed protein product [Cladocopium goreaui]
MPRSLNEHNEPLSSEVLAPPHGHRTMPKSEFYFQATEEHLTALILQTFYRGAVATGPQRFLVDNSLLRSDSSGLRYCTSLDGDKNPALKPVAWGHCVWGVLNDTQTWLKVKAGRRLDVLDTYPPPPQFPPAVLRASCPAETVQGCSVLKLQLDDPEPFEVT